jgi:hypothetical protein
LQNAREQRAHDTDLFMAEAKIKLSQGSGLWLKSIQPHGEQSRRSWLVRSALCVTT